jgi:hypothetical protein
MMWNICSVGLNGSNNRESRQHSGGQHNSTIYKGKSVYIERYVGVIYGASRVLISEFYG